MKSVIQSKKECYICRMFDDYRILSDRGLHKHHVFFGTANRAQSEKYGMTIWLCPDHHEHGPEAVHRNHDIDLMVKKKAQAAFEQTHTREEFRYIFGKSWL